MRWQAGRRSTNVEDIRDEEVPRRVPRGMQPGGGSILLILVVSLLTGQNPLQLLVMLDANAPVSAPQAPGPAGTDEAADFVSVILASTEDTWGAMFSSAGQVYPPPKLVLFSDLVESACGMNSTATGPFYCPSDRKVYLDLGFLRELKQLGVSGDFAVAYVIAHEVGHHVQNVVGTERRFRQLQSRVRSRAEGNALLVLIELQADCYAGVWAHHVDNQRHLLEEGDIEEGVNTAAAIGDDRLQRMGGRGVNPDAFTHGSSRQRVRWFRTGLQSGSVDACNTFAQLER